MFIRSRSGIDHDFPIHRAFLFKWRRHSWSVVIQEISFSFTLQVWLNNGIDLGTALFALFKVLHNID